MNDSQNRDLWEQTRKATTVKELREIIKEILDHIYYSSGEEE